MSKAPTTGQTGQTPFNSSRITLDQMVQAWEAEESVAKAEVKVAGWRDVSTGRFIPETLN